MGKFVEAVQVPFIDSHKLVISLSVGFHHYLIFTLSSLCSSKPAGNDVIGIDLGTTNSCVAVMDGKVKYSLQCTHMVD